MEDGLLSLKWNNHKSTFFHILSGLRKKGTYTDATLACEGNFFPVHKLVMSTCSDYFGEVFERTTCKSPVVILKDIRHHDLEALLDYMYLGEVDVKQSELAGLIKAAECLKIKGLAVPDEDPLLSQKKTTTHVPESRSSPVAKRSRRESGEADGPHHHYGSHKARRSLSPTPSRSHPSSTSTSVPSQSVNSDSLSQVPSHTMPPPLYSDTRQLPEFSSDGDVQKHPDQSLVPVDMIKVEVDDEGNNNNSQIRRQDGPSEPNDRREEPRGEGGGGDSSDGLREDKDSMSNSYPNYSSHPGEIEKEEHDQLDTYNGSDQIPGPSGVQGAPQMMNWGEEEGNFPHNLFGGDDSSHQQVNNKDGHRLKPMKIHLMRIKEECLSKARLPKPSLKKPLEKKPQQKKPLPKKLTLQKKLPLQKPPDIEESSFEGFECLETGKSVSELKRRIIVSRFQGREDDVCSSHSEESEPEEEEVFQEYTPFEVVAQEFEDELSLIPFEVCFKEENEIEYVPPFPSSPISASLKRKFLCYQCNSSFQSKKMLNLHVNEHDSSSYACPVCPYKGRDLISHIGFHSDMDGKGGLMCVLCRAPVHSMINLLKHLKCFHSY